MEKPTKIKQQNKVLQDDFRTSSNFYESDLILRHFLDREVSGQGRKTMETRLQYTGKVAATEMNPLSLAADKMGPTLKKRNFYGELVNEIEFHPSYQALLKMAVESGMFRVKWDTLSRQAHQEELHRLGFAAGFIYAMSESGLFCPLCMTDGVARLIDRYCTEEDKARLLPHIATDQVDDLYTGAMFLTEKAGGSDVGANLVTATHDFGEYYLLNGEKWFCSNANAEIIFALARTDEATEGTRGLSIFMIEKQRPDGSKNEMNIIRLKDKLGVRSMASAEIILTNTHGKLVGKEGQGFKIMTDMINLSRLYNSIAAIAASRRAMIESYQFLQYRVSFGKPALDHALIRDKMQELCAIQTANFYLTWRSIKLLDLADNGNANAASLLRLMTPMVKRATAEDGVYVIRESMELMGGMGYIEDGVMPKLMRDSMVLPIWEGAGNIMILDMLRASFKSAGLPILLEDLKATFSGYTPASSVLLAQLEKLQQLFEEIAQQQRSVLETSAKYLFLRLTRLTQIATLIHYLDDTSEAWIQPSLDYLIDGLEADDLVLRDAPSREVIEGMMAWEF